MRRQSTGDRAPRCPLEWAWITAVRAAQGVMSLTSLPLGWGRMDLPRTPPLALRLLPQAQRAFLIPAAGLSLGLHGVVVTLALAGPAQWITPRPASITARQTAAAAITYVDITRSPDPPSGRSANSAARYGTRSPSAPTHGSSPSVAGLPPVRPAVLTFPTAALPLALRISGLQPTTADAPVSSSRVGTGPAGGVDAVVGRSGDGWRGSSQVAELLTKAGDACPELRLPRPDAGRTGLEVAVSFVVDSLGAVDASTLQVVQAPGRSVLEMRFIPHIYALGATARVDRRLPEATADFGAIIARDVLRHVAGLQFRPGTRNGRPTRSSVMISCRSEQSGQ